MIEQDVKALSLRFQARVQLDLFEELFRRRIHDESLRLPKGMELAFLEPASAAEARIHAAILEYRAAQKRRWEGELSQQKERLFAAERRLVTRSTKTAQNQLRIAQNKVAWFEAKLDELSRDQPQAEDARIYPRWYAPVITLENDEWLVRPMRYHLRPSNKPASIDAKFDGLYNARRDSLTGFWREQFGRRHAIVVMSAFFENVARHDYEHRALGTGERVGNVVVRFEPQPVVAGQTPPQMTVACLWDRWVGADAPDLYSFAAVTDSPPEDVNEAGHDRCVVPLRPEHVPVWLTPETRRDEELFRILADRAAHRFGHRLAG